MSNNQNQHKVNQVAYGFGISLVLLKVKYFMTENKEICMYETHFFKLSILWDGLVDLSIEHGG